MNINKYKIKIASIDFTNNNFIIMSNNQEIFESKIIKGSVDFKIFNEHGQEVNLSNLESGDLVQIIGFTKSKHNQLTDPEDKQLTDPEDKQLTDPEDKQLTDPEDKQLTDLEHKQLTDPEDKQLTDPEDKQLTDPEHKQLTDPEYKQLTNLEYKQLTNLEYKPLKPDEKKDVNELLKLIGESNIKIKNNKLKKTDQKNSIIIKKIIIKNKYVFNSESSEEFDSYDWHKF
jgi:hypothetical protein